MINWKLYYKNIPSSIKIGKSTFEVVWIDSFPKDKHQYGESRFGETKQIVLDINQPIKEAVHTYFHEMLHCLSYEYEADLSEKQVRRLEKGLKDLLKRDNIFKGDSSETRQRERRSIKTIRAARKKAW